MLLTLSEINIYPVKSLGGIAVEQSFAGERGLTYDRRWMITDADNKFLTQRDFPDFALIGTTFIEEGIKLFIKTAPDNQIILPYETSGDPLTAQVWDDSVTAVHYSKEADEWISSYVNSSCQFLYMPNSSRRLIPERFALNSESVSFADGFPYLVIGELSLNDLNNRLKEAVPMNRFRPNFVFTGGKAFEEDEWNFFSIGEVEFKAVKPCARCMITTIEQETAQKGKEPLATLGKYRMKNNQVLFGMNVIAVTNGIIKVGDRILLKE